jgi:hypothetical protein
MRPVETQYFASPKIKTQYFAARYRRNILRLPKIKTQNIASVRYARYRRKILRLYDMPGTDAKYCVSTACHGRRHESRISYLCILRKSHP